MYCTCPHQRGSWLGPKTVELVGASTSFYPSNWCPSEYMSGIIWDSISWFPNCLLFFFLRSQKPTNISPHIHTGFWQVQLLSTKHMLLFPVIKVSFAKVGNSIYLLGKSKASVFLAPRCTVTFCFGCGLLEPGFTLQESSSTSDLSYDQACVCSVSAASTRCQLCVAPLLYIAS